MAPAKKASVAPVEFIAKAKEKKSKKDGDAKEEKSDKTKKTTGKTFSDKTAVDEMIGDADEFPNDEIAVTYSDISEYHGRSSRDGTIGQFSTTFQTLLPREQTQLMQQLFLFNQMVGRLTSTCSSFAYELDYDKIIDKILAGAMDVLKMKKARLYGVDFNSLGQSRELWVVGGETGNLGASVSPNEWSGHAMKKRNAPVFSNSPREDDLWGESYIDLERADKKFKYDSLVAASVIMRDPIKPDEPAKVRYVLELFNKERHDGKGLRPVTAQRLEPSQAGGPWPILWLASCPRGSYSR